MGRVIESRRGIGWQYLVRKMNLSTCRGVLWSTEATLRRARGIWSSSDGGTTFRRNDVSMSAKKVEKSKGNLINCFCEKKKRYRSTLKRRMNMKTLSGFDENLDISKLQFFLSAKVLLEESRI
jgi:hypothetical protein